MKKRDFLAGWFYIGCNKGVRGGNNKI